MKHLLDAQLVHGFVENFLIDRFDEKASVGKHHLEWWRKVCEPYPYVAIAGPRRHAKTTALNHAFGLAASLFETHNFQIKVSKTWDLAVERIAHVKDEMLNNEKLISCFKPKIVQDQKDDIIVELPGGYRFRHIAMGMDQAKRGKTWGTVRPKLIIYDDTEDDEEVLNPNSRRQHYNKIRNVFLPMGGDDTWHRFFGTVLHQDGTLRKLLKNKSWHSALYEACNENIDQHSILWPQKFSREKLQKIKQLYADDADEDHSGGLAGFNMEYRNIALDLTTSFFRPADFRPMVEEDYKLLEKKEGMNFYVGGDLAFSTKEHRDYTVFFVVGIDADGLGYVVDQRRGRWDGKRVIDEMYSIEETWHPDEWFIEGGSIKATLGAALEIRMAKDGYLNIAPDLIPTKDKATRAMPIQARMRGRGLKWDTRADWYYDAQQELLEFTQEGTRGGHDDRVDALAWVGQGLKRMITPMTPEEEEEEELAEFRKEAQKLWRGDGRSPITGY